MSKPRKHWLVLSVTADQAELISFYMQKMLNSQSVSNPEWVEEMRDSAASQAKHFRSIEERDKSKRKTEE